MENVPLGSFSESSGLTPLDKAGTINDGSLSPLPPPLTAKSHNSLKQQPNSRPISQSPCYTVAIVGAKRIGKSQLSRAIQRLANDTKLLETSFNSSADTHIRLSVYTKDLETSTPLSAPFQLRHPVTSRIYSLKLLEVDIQSLLQLNSPDQKVRWPNPDLPHVFLICFDVSDRASFMHIADICDFAIESGRPIHLIGLKSDTRDAIRQVDYSMGECVAKLFGITYTEASTITVSGIQAIRYILFHETTGVLSFLDNFTSEIKRGSKKWNVNRQTLYVMEDGNFGVSQLLFHEDSEESLTIVKYGSDTDETETAKGEKVAADGKERLNEEDGKKKASISDEFLYTPTKNHVYNFQNGIASGSEDKPFRQVFGDASLPVLRQIIMMKKVELLKKYSSTSRDSVDGNLILNDNDKTTSSKSILAQRKKAAAKTINEESKEYFSMDDILGSYADSLPMQIPKDENGSQGKVTSTASGFPTRRLTAVTTKIADLVDNLTSESLFDLEFTKCVLFAFRKFYTPSELVNSLINRFDAFYESSTASSSNDQSKMLIHIVQLRICNVFSLWISNYFDQDFNPDVSNGKKLQALDLPPHMLVSGLNADNQESSSALFDLLIFIEIIAAKDEIYRSLCQKLIEACWNQEVAKIKVKHLLREDSIIPIDALWFCTIDASESDRTSKIQCSWPQTPQDIPRESFIEWFLGTPKNGKDTHSLEKGIHPIDLASVLTQLTLESFVKISPREWMNILVKSSSKERRNRISPHLSSAVMKSKMISQWVMATILSFTETKDRAVCFGKFVETAWILYNDMHNYDSAVAVLEGLNNRNILRLKNTRNVVQGDHVPAISSLKHWKTARNFDTSTIGSFDVWEKYSRMSTELSSLHGFLRYRELYETVRNEVNPNHVIDTRASSPPTESSGAMKGLRKNLGQLTMKATETIRKRLLSGPSYSKSTPSLVDESKGSSVSVPTSPFQRFKPRRNVQSVFATETPVSASMENTELKQKPAKSMDNLFTFSSSAVVPDLRTLFDYSKMFVPIISLAIEDLSKLDDSISDYLGQLGTMKVQNTNDKPINWKKFANIYDTVENIKTLQERCCKFLESNHGFMERGMEKNMEILRRWILLQKPISDEVRARSKLKQVSLKDIYAQSSFLEPNFVNSPFVDVKPNEFIKTREGSRSMKMKTSYL